MLFLNVRTGPADMSAGIAWGVGIFCVPEQHHVVIVAARGTVWHGAPSGTSHSVRL
jgi:hypothetical protein